MKNYVEIFKGIFNTPWIKLTLIFLFTLSLLSSSINKTLHPTDPKIIFASYHTVSSLLLAMSSIVCHKPAYIDRNAIAALENYAPNLSQLIPTIIFDVHQSSTSDEYCKRQIAPFVMTENTLHWILQGILKFWPKISFKILILLFFVLEMSLIGFFIYYLFCLRIPMIYVLILTLIAVGSLTLQMPQHVLSQYALLLPGTLGLISLLGFGILRKWYQNDLYSIVFSLSIGSYVLLLYHLRTTYLIVAGCAIITYFLVLFLYEQPSTLKKYRLIMQLILIFSTLFLSNSFIKKTLVPTDLSGKNQENLTYHHIAHPLVLALALPKNKFSEEQGIEWYDDVGLTLARKINPSVAYITPEYEQTLFIFYRSLWKRYPKEMLQVYYEKFKLAGRSVVDGIGPYRRLIYPLSCCNGIEIFLIQVAFFVWLLKNSQRLSRNYCFLGLSLSLIGMTLYFESAIIMSVYRPAYHAVLLFWLVSLNLIVWMTILKLINRITTFVKLYFEPLIHRVVNP